MRGDLLGPTEIIRGGEGDDQGQTQHYAERADNDTCNRKSAALLAAFLGLLQTDDRADETGERNEEAEYEAGDGHAVVALRGRVSAVIPVSVARARGRHALRQVLLVAAVFAVILAVLRLLSVCGRLLPVCGRLLAVLLLVIRWRLLPVCGRLLRIGVTGLAGGV